MKFLILLSLIILPVAAKAEGNMAQRNLTIIDQSVHVPMEKFDAELSTRVACRRISPDETIVNRCIAYRASSSMIESCSKIFKENGKAVVDCIAYNRPAELMEACSGFSANDETKIRCLALNYSPRDVRACSETRGEDWKLDCLKGKFRNPIQLRINF